LVQGFARLVQVVDPSSDAHLVLAGPSWDGSKGKLESLAADLGIRDQMTMPGGVFGDEKKALIRQCDFFVHPSRWEAGVPFSVLEALAYGKQCLVSSAVDRQKVLQQSGVGEECELTVEGMASGLSVLSQQAPEERARKALKAQELIRRDFSWETSARKLVDGYRKFLSGGLR
jgi:glycosyltransferase involved in cell wall biosynthesis